MNKSSLLLTITLVLLLTGCGQQNETVTLSSMVGKNIRDSEIQKWLSKVGDSATITNYDECFFYSFKKRGFSLRFDKTGTLTNIILYSEGADGYRQYQGKLPFKLSFVLSRNEIESLLGKSDKSGGGGLGNYWVSYTSKGISMTYNSKQTDDLNARINIMFLESSR